MQIHVLSSVVHFSCSIRTLATLVEGHPTASLVGRLEEAISFLQKKKKKTRVYRLYLGTEMFV